MAIDDDVAAAMRYARKQWMRTRSRATLEQWARELARLVGSEVTPGAVAEMEAATMLVPSNVLVAAARLVEQPVSVLLRELDAYEVTIPTLERRIGELEARLESAGLL